ncbi:hypothetical protein LJB89_00500 [Tyzzerella sp. OttesenSCG-928-J15]|nr:hypothetical protein [Tyzzerella sp. OttesenSCG-928-J15]
MNKNNGITCDTACEKYEEWKGKSIQSVNSTEADDIAKLLIGWWSNGYPSTTNFCECLFAQSPAIQSNFTLLCIHWLYDLSEVRPFNDDRNKASIQWADHVKSNCELYGFLPQKKSAGKNKQKNVCYCCEYSVLHTVFNYLAESKGDFSAFTSRYGYSYYQSHPTSQQTFCRMIYTWFYRLVEKYPKSNKPYIAAARLATKNHEFYFPHI